MQEAHTCKCSDRTETPEGPEGPIRIEGNGKNSNEIRTQIVMYCATSTFRNCKTQAIPVSRGEPIRLHMSEDYSPRNHTKPADVALHLRMAVRMELERDLMIGVLRKVPVNTPSYS